MAKYISVPKGALVLHDAYSQEGSAFGEFVYETEKLPVKTGLLDASGTPLFRIPEQHPLGFAINPKAKG